MHMLHYIFLKITLISQQLSTIQVDMSNPIVSSFSNPEGVRFRQSCRICHIDIVLSCDLNRRWDNESRDCVDILHLQTNVSSPLAGTKLPLNYAPRISLCCRVKGN